MFEKSPDKPAVEPAACDDPSYTTNFDPNQLRTTRLLISLALLISIGLVGIGIWLYNQEWIQGLQWVTWLVLATGLTIFLLSIHFVEDNNGLNRLNRFWGKLGAWFGIYEWQVVGLIVSPVLALVAWVAAGTGEKMNSPFLAIICWLGGIGLVILSAWQFTNEGKPVPWRVVITALAVFLLALLIRGVFLTNIPIVLSGDEGSAGLSAVGFVKGETNNIFRSGWFSFPALYFFIQSIPISFLGQTILSLRITSIIAGSLSVVGVYLFGRAMFGERAGLFSALFLAAFHFHNHFSRIGLNNIWDSMWFVIVLGLLWAGWQYENRRLLVLSGLALGFSQYFYISARVLFLLIPAWLVIAAIIEPARIRRLFPSFILMGMAALVTVMPLALYYLGYPSEFMAPMRRTSILGNWLANEAMISGLSAGQILLNQLWTSLLAYAHEPLRAWYMPGVPLLRPLSALVFFLGLCILLVKPRDGRTALLGLWLVSLTIMVGMSESTPAAQRYVAVSPAVAILVGYGLAGTTDRLGKLWCRAAPLLNVVGIGLILFISLDDLRFYYFDYTPRSDFGGANTLIAQQLANYLVTQPDDLEVFFLGGTRMGYYSHSSLPFLAPHVKGVDINHPWGSPENPQPTSQNLLFVFLPETHEELESIKASYPGGKYMEIRKNDGQPLFWLYSHSPSEPPPHESHLPGETRPLAIKLYTNTVIGGYL